MRTFFTFFATLSLVSAALNDTCKTRSQRKAWHTLTDSEKSEYIEAVECLQSAAPQLNIDGAESRWDEIQYVHVVQTPVIHNVGAFLPWHRMYVRAVEYLLQSECGYTGGQPYWNETRDVGAIANSTIWDADAGFGGNGTGVDLCVEDGPFANLTLHFVKNAGRSDYCLSRDWDEETLDGASQSEIDVCLDSVDFETVWDCLEGQPHAAGHGGTGGTMSDLSSSSGDPLFFLHHAWLDKIWWEWQSQNSSRLTEIGGDNVPPDSYYDFTGLDYPSAAILDYDGDPGNTTTLNHNLWMAGITDNFTIGDVMDLDNNLNCAEYV